MFSFYLAFFHGTCHWQTMFDLVFLSCFNSCFFSAVLCEWFSVRVILVLVQLHIDSHVLLYIILLF